MMNDECVRNIIKIMMIFTLIFLEQKSKSSCNWWFRLRVILLMGFIIYFFIVMGQSRLFLYGLIDILLIFYRVYCLCIVDSFTKEIEKDIIRENRRRISIVVPHVQIITPDGSFSGFPSSPSGQGQRFPYPPPLSIFSRNHHGRDEENNGHPYERLA